MRKPLLLPFSQLLPAVLFLRAVLSRGNGTNSSSEFHRQATVKERKKEKKKIIGSLIAPILTLAAAPRIFAITGGIFVAVLAKWYVQKKKK